MLVEQMLGTRLHEEPKDAQTPGHRLLLRGGYVQQIGQGIFALLPLGNRVSRNVAQIIREEMDKIGGQEILMPVVCPAELWERSGRYDSVGSELVRFEDRAGRPNVLSMTHEEVVVDIAGVQIKSYRQLPRMTYQIQTKFRDEPRSRGGLIRVREFTMKDAYSFHRTQEDLEAYYDICFAAYERIFERCGLRDVVSIKSDSGMMGGKVAHEFMLVSDVGEDTLVLCGGCEYRANREVAYTRRAYPENPDLGPLERVETPGHKTIEEVASFLGVTAADCCKAVAFLADGERPVVAFVRGDLEVNHTKLRNLVKAHDLFPMQDADFATFGIAAGFIGPQGLPESVRVVIDESIAGTPNLVVGANEPDAHCKGFNLARDLPDAKIDDIASVNEGDPCPECGAGLRTVRGVEVGNIFQLGSRYTEAMDVTYAEEDGSRRSPIMGCYGIGVGRTLACIVEESHDDYGPLWPVSVAPHEAHIVAIGAKKQDIRDAAEALYRELRAAGVDVLLDHRNVGTGVLMADADLIGAPVRLIVSKRNLAKDQVEVKYRTCDPHDHLPTSFPTSEAVAGVQEALKALRAPYEAIGATGPQT